MITAERKVKGIVCGDCTRGGCQPDNVCMKKELEKNTIKEQNRGSKGFSARGGERKEKKWETS